MRRRSTSATKGQGQITFLDGKLDKKAMLDISCFYEHTILVGSDWKHYVCTAEIDRVSLARCARPATSRPSSAS